MGAGGIRTPRSAHFALVLILTLAPLAAAFPMPGVPEEGPDIPAATPPIATITVLENEIWSYTAGFRGNEIAVPTGWDRVVLEFTQVPIGDPWDRTFAASVAGVEVLRGTTPRTPMTIEKDITRYASLLPQGGVSRVEAYTDTYVGAMSVTLKLRFYADLSALLVAPPVDAIANVQRFGGLCTGGSFARTVDFDATAPSSATIELFLSGHGSEEFWFQRPGATRIARVFVDDTEVGNALIMPYTYAFIGFAGADGQMGPQHQTLHTVMWWTAQQALDKAGVHVNSGEIPPYRVSVHADELPLLTGTREVRVEMDALAFGGGCTWTTSAAFLMD